MKETRKKRKEKPGKKIVLVFGTFDGIHDGHRFFLRQARKCGGKLITVVAQDSVVKELKRRPPREPLSERLARLRAAKLADKIVAGDNNINSWNILKKYKPDIICLGYDQTALAASLKAWVKKEKLPTTIVSLPAYHKSQYHSFLLS